MSIVKIGNSQGIIIPMKLLNTIGTPKQVDIQAKNGKLIVRPLAYNVRDGWEEKFKEAVSKGFLPENDIFNLGNDFDEEEWNW